mmetsp:Transcript_5094/g.20332  ORF Transcript_5094/g.20332 Transcript_5094/m.20332 type:complete len:222 (+) Transcript_5094:2611-3276(+)
MRICVLRREHVGVRGRCRSLSILAQRQPRPRQEQMDVDHRRGSREQPLQNLQSFGDGLRHLRGYAAWVRAGVAGMGQKLPCELEEKGGIQDPVERVHVALPMFLNFPHVLLKRLVQQPLVEHLVPVPQLVSPNCQRREKGHHGTAVLLVVIGGNEAEKLELLLGVLDAAALQDDAPDPAVGRPLVRLVDLHALGLLEEVGSRLEILEHELLLGLRHVGVHV